MHPPRAGEWQLSDDVCVCVMALSHSCRCQNLTFTAYSLSCANTAHRKYGISIHCAWQLHGAGELIIAAWSYCPLITRFKRNPLSLVSVWDRFCGTCCSGGLRAAPQRPSQHCQSFVVHATPRRSGDGHRGPGRCGALIF